MVLLLHNNKTYNYVRNFQPTIHSLQRNLQDTSFMGTININLLGSVCNCVLDFVFTPFTIDSQK